MNRTVDPPRQHSHETDYDAKLSANLPTYFMGADHFAMVEGLQNDAEFQLSPKFSFATQKQ